MDDYDGDSGQGLFIVETKRTIWQRIKWWAWGRRKFRRFAMRRNVMPNANENIAIKLVGNVVYNPPTPPDAKL